MSSFLLLTVLLFALSVAFAMVMTGWREALIERKDVPSSGEAVPPLISVLVPARNEEANVTAVLQDLFAQRYPRDRMEVIVIDDGSTDRTAELVHGMVPRWKELQILPSAAPGKKAAITTGVQAAKGDIIILTDADVRFGVERVGAIAAHWRAERSDMIVLPVFTEGHGALGRMQEEEQSALLGMAMGSAARGRPVLAYGANLAFTREAFRAVGGYQGDRFASGDDLFLLRRMQLGGRKISGLFNARVLVKAAAAPGVRSFFEQRLRWAGKMRGVAGPSFIGSAALVLPWVLLYCTCSLDVLGRIGNHALYSVALLVCAWACWLIPVISLVRTVRSLAGRTTNEFVTLLSLLAFSSYAPLIALASLVLRPQWKGRGL